MARNLGISRGFAKRGNEELRPKLHDFLTVGFDLQRILRGEGKPNRAL